ncbi:jg7058 [Pararge aegeria aegeria]|uniref:Jg7058 protein n=1 Tax=Pararge aegeria aegeria TaxID=348720 RepID=A0A8S4RIH5_9NEOP|nr:jg7058 [Pararge aegeria aegeria]
MDVTSQEKKQSEKVETSANTVDGATENLPLSQAEVVEEVIGKPKHAPNSESVITFDGCPAGYHRVGPICVPNE